MASKLNVNLTDLQSLVVSPTLLSRSNTHSTRLDGHDSSLNSIFSTAVTTAGATFTGDVTVEGSFTVTGTYADVKNLDISDNLIGLNKGLTTRSATRDAGIVIERGDASNVFMGFDESTQKFTMGTTTSLASHAGNMENFAVSTLLANLEGKIVSGDVSGGSLDVSFAQQFKTSTAQNLAIFKSGIGANDANLDIGDFSLRAETLISDVPTGNAPLTVSSTTQVANLHASQVTGDASGNVNVVTGKKVDVSGGTVDVSFGTLTTSTLQKKAIVEGVGSSLDLSGTDLSLNKLEVDVEIIGAAGTFTALTANDSLTVNAGASIIGDTTNEVTLNVRGVADQTVDLFKVENSAEVAKFVVDKDGLITSAGLTVTGNLNAPGVTVNSLIVNKAQKLETNAVDISSGASDFTDNDVLVRLGALDTDDLTDATHISFKNIYIDVSNAATTGNPLTGALFLGTANNDAQNAAVTNGVELVGAGVTGQTADINLESATETFVRNIGVTTAIANKELYLTTSTTTADISGNGLGIKVVVDYDLVKL